MLSWFATKMSKAKWFAVKKPSTGQTIVYSGSVEGGSGDETNSNAVVSNQYIVTEKMLL